MTTCATHGWNQPCYTCARLQRQDDARRRDLWQLGHTRSFNTDKTITVRTPKLFSPLFFLPEVDPVTMRGTGGVKTARLA